MHILNNDTAAIDVAEFVVLSLSDGTNVSTSA